MKKKSERLLDSIFSHESEDIDTLKAELKDGGVNIDGLIMNVKGLIDGAKKAQKKSWLKGAKEAAAEFREKSANISKIANPKAVLQRIIDGEFGDGIQNETLVLLAIEDLDSRGEKISNKTIAKEIDSK